MTTATIVYALLFYLAATVLIVGLALKIKQYASTPVPLKIPMMPAPLTRAGSAVRIFKEVVFFKSLFKANKWTWIFGWMFHVALVLVVMRHLRYFTDPVWTWVALVQPFGLYAGFAMIAGLGGLWVRRLAVDRVRYISAPSDHLFLLLLLGIGGTGMLMKYVAHTDIVALKAFMLGVVWFDWQPIPTDTVLLVHLSLVLALMVVFPFSKMLHAPGLFFNPTRYQIDNARERRHAPRRRAA